MCGGSSVVYLTMAVFSDAVQVRLAAVTGASPTIETMSNCLCGHDRAAHQRHRAGSDCALCRPGSCRHFRSDLSVSQWQSWFRAGAARPAADPIR